MTTATARRQVYIVLSARSLSYAEPCIGSLLRNAAEPLDIAILTDGPDDAAALEQALRPLVDADRQALHIHDQADADRRAETILAAYPAVAAFRRGHPCWRKVTDPALYATAGEEVIILDPDVYFPNRFTFEATPDAGIALMWQRPNCLLPEALVRQAFDLGIAMADHTDIGICQFRAPLPFAYLEDLLTRLDTTPYVASMHVESVVWAALAEHAGGRHLDPVAWHCFRNSVGGRLMRRLQPDPMTALRRLDFATMKAFHAGGVAKRWLRDAERQGLFASPGECVASTTGPAYAPFQRHKFATKMRIRRVVERLGFYKLLGSN